MPWNWTALGNEVERARKACVPRGQPGHDEAARRFHAAYDAVWPPGFFEALEGCKRGDPAGLNGVLEFVEVRPYFFRSGYVWQTALRSLRKPPRTSVQAHRMRQIVLNAARGRPWVPMRGIPSLGAAVDSPELREVLRSLTTSDDSRVSKRAIAVLDGLPGAPWDAERARVKRIDDRVGAMIVTAQVQKSATLLRRVLAIDPAPLTTRGRHYLAVAFEFAMNWGLLTDDELVAVAKRIDGPEMEPIWQFGSARKDAVGVRARKIWRSVRA